jgi:hypothetical protein
LTEEAAKNNSWTTDEKSNKGQALELPETPEPKTSGPIVEA